MTDAALNDAAPNDAARLVAFTRAVSKAAAALAPVMEPTPLQENAYLSARYGARILLKREDLTPVRSYKLRGAYTFFRKALARATPPSGFVCASAGNHAQGFAFACKRFGVEGAVFMPVTTPQQKIDKTKAFGGDNVTIRLVGDIFDQCNAAALAYAAETGGAMVPPFDHPDIIEGQATVAFELLAQAPSLIGDAAIDLLILPVGGGGLSAGVTQIIEAQSPETEILLVEPAGAPSLKTSLAAGARTALERVDTFVDGAAVAEIGAAPWEVLRRFAPEAVTLIDENQLCVTILEMLNIEGIVLEPAGALEIAALEALGPERLAGKTVAALTSGGNFDFERLPEVKERALKAQGLKKYFILRLPQRPGALRDFLGLLGPDDDISRFEYLKKSARNFGSILIGIETSRKENFDALCAAMDAAGFQHRDITDDEVVASLVV